MSKATDFAREGAPPTEVVTPNFLTTEGINELPNISQIRRTEHAKLPVDFPNITISEEDGNGDNSRPVPAEDQSRSTTDDGNDIPESSQSDETNVDDECADDPACPKPKDRYDVAGRLARQAYRIARGVENGSLTQNELDHLQKVEERIQDAYLKAMEGGLDAQEKRRLAHMLDFASLDIFYRKHNNKNAGDASPPGSDDPAA